MSYLYHIIPVANINDYNDCLLIPVHIQLTPRSEPEVNVSTKTDSLFKALTHYK